MVKNKSLKKLNLTTIELTAEQRKYLVDLIAEDTWSFIALNTTVFEKNQSEYARMLSDQIEFRSAVLGKIRNL